MFLAYTEVSTVETILGCNSGTIWEKVGFIGSTCFASLCIIFAEVLVSFFIYISIFKISSTARYAF